MTDDWLIAESIDGSRTYVFHVKHPRLAFRVFADDDPEMMRAASSRTGLKMQFGIDGGRTLVPVWFEGEPFYSDSRMLLLTEDAGAAFNEHKARGGRER